MAILLLLLAAQLLKAFKFCLNELHDTAQCACLREVDVLCLTTLYIWHVILHCLSFIGADGISNARPDTHKLREVHIACKAVILLELAVCGELQHLCEVTEVADKIVKVIDAIFLHGVSWHEIAHECPYLGCCVTDRCAGSKDYVASVVLLHNGLRLQIYALRLLAV